MRCGGHWPQPQVTFAFRLTLARRVAVLSCVRCSRSKGRRENDSKIITRKYSFSSSFRSPRLLPHADAAHTQSSLSPPLSGLESREAMDCCFSCLGAKKTKKPPPPMEKPQIPPTAGDPPAPAILFPAIFLLSCSAPTPGFVQLHSIHTLLC
jgi:hypothetical protein